MEKTKKRFGVFIWEKWNDNIENSCLNGFVILKESGEGRNQYNLRKEINQQISDQIGPIAKLDKIQFVT